MGIHQSLLRLGLLTLPTMRWSLGAPCRWAFPGFVGPKANGAHMAVAASTREAASPPIPGGTIVAAVEGFQPSLLNSRLNRSQCTLACSVVNTLACSAVFHSSRWTSAENERGMQTRIQHISWLSWICCLAALSYSSHQDPPWHMASSRISLA